MARTFPTMSLVAALAVTGWGVNASNAAAMPGQSDRQISERAPATSVEIDPSDRGVIPIGQEVDLRLQTTLSSETSKAEQRFEATTVSDLMQDGRVLVPAGTVVRGVVSAVSPAGRLESHGDPDALVRPDDRARTQRAAARDGHRGVQERRHS